MSSSTDGGRPVDPYAGSDGAASPQIGDAPRRNIAGLAALVLAIVYGVFGLVTNVVTYLVPIIADRNALSISEIGVLFGALGVVGTLIALAAAVLGLVGILRRGAPQRAAAAGLGIGVLGVVSGIFALVAGPVLGLIVG